MEDGRRYILNRKFSDIICQNTNIANIQPDVFRMPNDNDNRLEPCTRDDGNELINLIQQDNFLRQDCIEGFTNEPACDQCADGFEGYPNCTPGT